VKEKSRKRKAIIHLKNMQLVVIIKISTSIAGNKNKEATCQQPLLS